MSKTLDSVGSHGRVERSTTTRREREKERGRGTEGERELIIRG